MQRRTKKSYNEAAERVSETTLLCCVYRDAYHSSAGKMIEETQTHAVDIALRR